MQMSVARIRIKSTRSRAMTRRAVSILSRNAPRSNKPPSSAGSAPAANKCDAAMLRHPVHSHTTITLCVFAHRKREGSASSRHDSPTSQNAEVSRLCALHGPRRHQHKQAYAPHQQTQQKSKRERCEIVGVVGIDIRPVVDQKSHHAQLCLHLTPFFPCNNVQLGSFFALESRVLASALPLIRRRA